MDRLVPEALGSKNFQKFNFRPCAGLHFFFEFIVNKSARLDNFYCYLSGKVRSTKVLSNVYVVKKEDDFFHRCHIQSQLDIFNWSSDFGRYKQL